jgi:EF-P beta-lysylation protein EpmB
VDWQIELSESFTDAAELCRYLNIPFPNVQTEYPLLVPRSFVKRMQHGNPNDPLLLQVLPSPEENVATSGFSCDPLGEAANVQSSCVLQKYPKRVLVLASDSCGVHCRFCFRRQLKRNRPNHLSSLLPFIETLDAPTEELILSGGDPLMLNNEALEKLIQQIIKLPNIKRLRIHSRLPVVLPSRMTEKLNAVLTLPKPIPVYLVLHVNHPNELDGEFAERRRLLVSPVLMSQTVLLRGINDHLETLEQLFTRLANLAIVPYYLHQLDKVQGAAHFEVPISSGCKLIAELRNRLPGYAVPRYVQEIEGLSGKMTLVSEHD